MLTMEIVIQWSCIGLPLGCPAHCPASLTPDTVTPWIARGSSAADGAPRTAASSGDLAPGRRPLLLVLGDWVTCPGPLALAVAPT